MSQQNNNASSEQKQQQQPARSFVDALAERYGAKDDSNVYSADAFNVGASNSSSRKATVHNKKWEMVGMDMAREKQSQYDRIRVLGLQNCNIAKAEKENGQISRLKLERVRELDLSDNKDLQAAEVEAIVAALGKSLVELQLSGTDVGNVNMWCGAGSTAVSPASSSSPAAQAVDFPPAAAAAAAAAAPATEAAPSSTTTRLPQQLNRFQLGSSLQSIASVGSDLSSSPSSPFRSEGWSRLTTLALNRCNMSWAAILDAFPSQLTSLTSLHCESNGITKIACRSALVTLSSATASPDASVSALSLPLSPSSAASAAATTTTATSTAAMFPALTELNLSFNRIRCSLDDAEMNLFLCKETPKLISLNLTENDLVIPEWWRPQDESEQTAAAATANKEKETNYLVRLQHLYIAGNSNIMKNNYSSSSDKASKLKQEEPLQALEWIRASCPVLKALRVSYEDFFGPSSSSIVAAASSEQRRPSDLSEVQQRSLVISSIGHIDMLNSGTVRQKERLDAEVLYLQVAKAKQKQQQQQKEAAAAAAAAGSTASEVAAAAAPTAAVVTVSATQRFFPWSNCPRLGFLEEKHKDVVLSSLHGDQQQGAAGNSMTAALKYQLQLTFRLLSKDSETQQQDQQQDAAEIEGTSRSQRRERAKRTNATALTDDVTRTVPGNMTVGKLRSFVASLFPALAPLNRQKKLQAYPADSTIVPPTVLAAVDDEQPLILCGVPSTAVIEVFV